MINYTDLSSSFNDSHNDSLGGSLNTTEISDEDSDKEADVSKGKRSVGDKRAKVKNTTTESKRCRT